MKLVDEISVNISSASRGGYIDGLMSKSVVKVGGRYWNRINNFQKHAFSSSTRHTSKDDPDNDPHIFADDPEFQESVKRGATMFIDQANEQLRKSFKDSFGDEQWSDELKKYISKNKGGYTYAGLLKALSLYQPNPLDELSQQRRYDKVTGKAKEVPLSLKARHDAFTRYNMIDEGRKILANMTDEEQDALLRHALPKNTLSGWPSFTSQNSENMEKLTDDLCEIIGYPKLPMVKVNIKEHNKIKVIEKRYFTVKWIEDLIRFCDLNKWHAPFQGLYRTHWDKVRAVFGGNWILKLLGCLFVASKHLGYTKEVAELLKVPVNEDKYDLPIYKKPTKIYSRNNIPYISQLSWDVQFELYRDKLPPLINDGISEVSHQFLQDKFGVTMPSGNYALNVIGDDYSKFDTTVIPEDIEWLQGHLGFGWMFKYVSDCLREADVWITGLRIKKIYFKSGHPFTADWGTDIHHNRNLVAVALANAKAGGKVYEIGKGEIKSYITHKDVCDILRINGKYYVYEYSTVKVIRIIGDTNQSDDSILFVIGLTLKDMEEILSEFGLIIKASSSSDLIKDKFVTFLQMFIGWVLITQPVSNGFEQPIVIGNFVSRYLGMAHSERDLEEDSVGALTGVFEVTGDANLDAAISKIASGGKDSESIWVRPILMIVKNTVSGAKLIEAISNIDPTRAYELYRSDVVFGMNPSFLGTLKVRDYLVSDRLSKAVTET